MSIMTYKPDIRINNPIYLLKQAAELLKLDIAKSNSSFLIYAAVECRIALELLDLNFIKHSVTSSEREQIILDSKPKNGIDRVNKKVGVLKERYQSFFQAICELTNIESEYYNFKKSKDLQYQLSTYIHSYHMNDQELEYSSENMQICKNLVLEVDKFIKSSLPEKNGIYTIVGMEIASLPIEYRQVLNDWKTSNSMTYDEMKETLFAKIKLRRKENK